MHDQCTTDARTTSIVPASPEVILASVRGVDPDLVAEITDLRRRLDQIAPEVIELLAKVLPLEERVCEVADHIDNAPGNASGETWDRVSEVTGALELHRAARKIVTTYDAS